MKKNIVLLQGAFDIINAGHVRVFEFAKRQGDHLIVAVNTNKLLREYKGRDAVLPWLQKKRIISAIRFVDRVIPARHFSPFGLLRHYRPDVFVCGSEWVHAHLAEIAYVKSYGGRVVISPRFRGVVPTSEIKRRLLEEAQDRSG